ncbi:nucleotidyltransferase domain-containing protein [Terricaulis silvestris]|uniref:Polymerase beta nucleotidyltransferase domain-containing protein n=1 Tax=Terricaulis silvestris TaxID=2686094 RepID=A0A6I6MK61_9CAUL|nr:nucleotidyltransferase domain-containing protein [Terricaulis silvestris]QGZ93496.1 hypothetical protein DSM104635_00306 [Terricaulis silvestris]
MSLLPEEWISSIQLWARAIPELKQVFLFGSYARGEQGAASDLDLAAIIDVGRKGDDDDLVVWMFSHDDWATALQSRLPVSLDLQLGNPELSSDIVGPAVLAYGVLLYEREPT